MGDQLPQKDEISRKFIIDKKYGTTGGVYPPETLVLCRASFPSSASESSDFQDVAGNFNNLRLQGWIFRNGKNGHAEELCLQRLRQRDSQAQRIEVELIQSYAPCHNCADKIIEYKKEKETEGKTVAITITFANYYRWIGRGTDENGVKNLRKLKEMTESDIDLLLLQGRNSWKNLFEDDELVNLNDNDQTWLLQKATSPARINREGYDNDLFVLIMQGTPVTEWKSLPLR